LKHRRDAGDITVYPALRWIITENDIKTLYFFIIVDGVRNKLLLSIGNA
jgi:hypothetical protein